MMHTVSIIMPNEVRQLVVANGTVLRQALLNAGISPYTRLTRRLNCGGRGLCATCGVWLRENAPDPRHWHDSAAALFGYPRLSCQIVVDRDLTIELVDKWVWGAREPKRQSRMPDTLDG